MFSVYDYNKSLVDDKVKIHGNIKLVAKLKRIIKDSCVNHMGLYEAQDFIKNCCIDKYGIDFYEKNAEAIMFILENEYCTAERIKHPLFDVDSCLSNIKSNTMF